MRSKKHKKKKPNKLKLVITITVLFLIVLGAFFGGYRIGITDTKESVSENGYNERNYKRQLDGFYYRNVTEETVEEYQDKKDPYGDWVNVNIRDMSYERGLKVCAHEMGHELVAEILEVDDTELYKKFEEIIKEYERKNRR